MDRCRAANLCCCPEEPGTVCKYCTVAESRHSQNKALVERTVFKLPWDVAANPAHISHQLQRLAFLTRASMSTGADQTRKGWRGWQRTKGHWSWCYVCSSVCVEFSSRPLPIQKKFTTGWMQVKRIKRHSAQVCSLHFRCKLGALAVLAAWCTGCPEILKLVAECKGAASWEVFVINKAWNDITKEDKIQELAFDPSPLDFLCCFLHFIYCKH